MYRLMHPVCIGGNPPGPPAPSTTILAPTSKSKMTAPVSTSHRRAVARDRLAETGCIPMLLLLLILAPPGRFGCSTVRRITGHR